MSCKTIFSGVITFIAASALACFCLANGCCLNCNAQTTDSVKPGCNPVSCSKSCSSHTDSVSSTTDKPLVCKLTSIELQERKATIIAELKSKHLEKIEFTNGFSFKFEATDEMLDLLTDFVKSERQCCDFFNFAIRLENDNVVWLDITGPEGAKEFIQNELGM